MAEREPLLSHMSLYSRQSDSVQLIGNVNSGKMATFDGERLTDSQKMADSRESSFQTRSTGSSAADDFYQVQDNDPVAQALKQCEKWVLRPYRIVLRILGWTQFTRDGDPKWLLVLRILLVILWTLFLITTSVTQILSCFPRDRFSSSMIIVSQPSSRIVNDTTNQTSQPDFTREISCRDHLISSFVFFDLLLIFSYWFGLYLFSRGETEYLSNLAEKVFIKRADLMTAQTSNMKKSDSNRWMIFTILTFLVVGMLWILVSFAVRLMTARTVRLFESRTIIRWSSDTTFEGAGKLVLVILSLVGFFTFDMVYVTAVMNYAAQSEMLVYLLRTVRGLVEEKKYEDIDSAVKDIMEIRKYLRVLNGKTAAGTALILYNLGSAGVLAIITLDEISEMNNDYFDEQLATVAAGLNVLLWMGLVCFPFIQAARVTDECGKLKETGTFVRTRPFQYSQTPQLDLDSYVSFTQAIKLRATMFGIPIHPWMAYFVLVVFTFTMLVLFQTDVYSFTSYL